MMASIPTTTSRPSVGELMKGVRSGSWRRPILTPSRSVGISPHVIPGSSPLPRRFSGSFSWNARPWTVATAARVMYRFSQFSRIFSSPSSPRNTTPSESIDAASEPASGSVRAKHGISSPRARPGSHRSFCSSVP